ncbi:hypothetical protein [Cytobacillus firmus]|uniref:hypothetical protein n=1 Tax=Cytobacillus firmus TaxID=1399 RepID=UPI003002F966
MDYSIYENKALNNYQLLLEAILKRSNLYNDFIWNECGLFYNFNRNISQYTLTPYYRNLKENLLQVHNINMKEFRYFTVNHTIDKLQELIEEHKSVGIVIGDPKNADKEILYWELLGINLESKEYVLVNHSEKVLRYYTEECLKEMLGEIASNERFFQFTILALEKSSGAYYPQNTSDLLRQLKEYVGIFENKKPLNSKDIEGFEQGFTALKQVMIDLPELDLESLAYSVKQFSNSRRQFSSFLKGFSQEELSRHFLQASDLWLDVFNTIQKNPHLDFSLLRKQFNNILEREILNINAVREFLKIFA